MRRDDEAPKTPAILGADALPVTDWENLGARVEVPGDIQGIIGLPMAVLRVSAAKHDLILSKHPNDRMHYLNLTAHLSSWVKIGYSKANVNWSVYYQDGGRWYVAILGQDESGSWNLISHWGTRTMSKMERRWRKEDCTDRGSGV